MKMCSEGKQPPSFYAYSTLAFRIILYISGIYISNTSVVNQNKWEIFLHVNQIHSFKIKMQITHRTY
jgi:hypothetical protein